MNATGDQIRNDLASRIVTKKMKLSLSEVKVNYREINYLCFPTFDRNCSTTSVQYLSCFP